MVINTLLPALMSIFLSAPAGRSDEGIHLFWTTYKSRQSTNSARIEAIHGLSSQPSLARANVFKKLLLTAPEFYRIEVAKALAKFRGIRGASILAAQALQHPRNRKSSLVRVELIRTLGSLQENAILPVLYKLINDKDLQVSRAAIEVTPQFKNKGSVQLLINALKKSEKTSGSLGLARTVTLKNALHGLTGQPLNHSREWSHWLGSMSLQPSLGK